MNRSWDGAGHHVGAGGPDVDAPGIRHTRMIGVNSQGDDVAMTITVHILEYDTLSACGATGVAKPIELESPWCQITNPENDAATNSG